MSTIARAHVLLACCLAAACGAAQPPPAPAGGDRTRNHAVIAHKAESDPRYARLLALAEERDLTIGIREFEMGEGARTQGEKMGGDYSWEFLNAAEDPVLARHVGAFSDHLERFPPVFLGKAGLRGVGFVRTLEWHGVQVYGFEVEDGVVFINLSLGGEPGFPGADEVAYGFTHELFHLIQNRLAADEGFIDYDAWDALNAKGAAYHPGGSMGMLEDALSGKAGLGYLHEEHPAPGFVSRYSMADHWHDTTETFCSLFVASRYRKATRWAAKDGPLAAKLAEMKRALRRLDPSLTDAYFERIHSGR